MSLRTNQPFGPDRQQQVADIRNKLNDDQTILSLAFVSVVATFGLIVAPGFFFGPSTAMDLFLLYSVILIHPIIYIFAAYGVIEYQNDLETQGYTFRTTATYQYGTLGPVALTLLNSLAVLVVTPKPLIALICAIAILVSALFSTRLYYRTLATINQSTPQSDLLERELIGSDRTGYFKSQRAYEEYLSENK